MSLLIDVIFIAITVFLGFLSHNMDVLENLRNFLVDVLAFSISWIAIVRVVKPKASNIWLLSLYASSLGVILRGWILNRSIQPIFAIVFALVLMLAMYVAYYIKKKLGLEDSRTNRTDRFR